MSKFKFIVALMSLVVIISNVFSSPVQAQSIETHKFGYYEDLGIKILKAFNYDEVTGKYTFDKDLAKQTAGLTDEQVNNVNQHLKTLDSKQLLLLQKNKKMSELNSNIPSNGSSDKAVQLLPLIGAAALAIIATVGTTVASNFANDIYKYGLTVACEKYKKYGSIKKFCTVNNYI